MEKNRFTICANNYIDCLRQEGRYSTAHVYKHAIRSFSQFCGTQSITFSRINRETLKRYSNYLLASTWFDGELPTYWDELLPELRTMKLKGKKVAIFGLGDQIRYPENFADGIGLLAEVFEGDEATLVGFTSSEGYTFEHSKALRGEQWCGLVVDLDNQSEQAEKKIKAWCQQVKKEFA